MAARPCRQKLCPHRRNRGFMVPDTAFLDVLGGTSFAVLEIIVKATTQRLTLFEELWVRSFRSRFQTAGGSPAFPGDQSSASPGCGSRCERIESGTANFTKIPALTSNQQTASAVRTSSMVPDKTALQISAHPCLDSRHPCLQPSYPSDGDTQSPTPACQAGLALYERTGRPQQKRLHGNTRRWTIKPFSSLTLRVCVAPARLE